MSKTNGFKPDIVRFKGVVWWHSFSYLKSTIVPYSLLFRQKYRQSIISRFSTRKWYVLGLNQKKNSSLYTYSPTHANVPQLTQMDNGTLKLDLYDKNNLQIN